MCDISSLLKDSPSAGQHHKFGKDAESENAASAALCTSRNSARGAAEVSGG